MPFPVVQARRRPEQVLSGAVAAGRSHGRATTAGAAFAGAAATKAAPAAVAAFAAAALAAAVFATAAFAPQRSGGRLGGRSLRRLSLGGVSPLVPRKPSWLSRHGGPARAGLTPATRPAGRPRRGNQPSTSQASVPASTTTASTKTVSAHTTKAAAAKTAATKAAAAQRCHGEGRRRKDCRG